MFYVCEDPIRVDLKEGQCDAAAADVTGWICAGASACSGSLCAAGMFGRAGEKAVRRSTQKRERKRVDEENKRSE